MDYITAALLAILGVALILQMIISYRERRDLYDRLMAGNLNDYKAHEEEIENDYTDEDEDEDLVPLEEAREDIEEDG